MQPRPIQAPPQCCFQPSSPSPACPSPALSGELWPATSRAVSVCVSVRVCLRVHTVFSSLLPGTADDRHGSRQRPFHRGGQRVTRLRNPGRSGERWGMQASSGARLGAKGKVGRHEDIGWYLRLFTYCWNFVVCGEAFGLVLTTIEDFIDLILPTNCLTGMLKNNHTN